MRLILTGWLIPDFTKSGFADLAVVSFFRFVWGALPSPDELATYLGPRMPDQARGSHWSDFSGGWARSKNRSHRDLGLAEFCRQYETVELWFDMEPNAQLQLVWLLDYFRSHPETVARLKLRLVDREMIGCQRLGKWQPPAIDVTERELVTASAAWQAYRASTPEACFDLFNGNVSALQAGLVRPARRASRQGDWTWRDGNAAARTDCQGILAHEWAFLPSVGSPAACIRRIRTWFPA
jgi:hypothetical protein